MSHWHNTREHRIWRSLVIRRDKTCVVCGSIKGRQAHHKNHGTYFPAERTDVENGVTLCNKCHSHYHCDYHRSFREKCTKYDFNNFMSLVNYFKEIL